MCWVIPPASVDATFFCRIASSIDVLPWSTWPIIVTTGGLDTRSLSVSSFPPRPNSTSDSLTRFGVWPNSITKSSAVSPSIVSLIVLITPNFISIFIRVDDFSAILDANSPTPIRSGIMISFFFLSLFSRTSLFSKLLRFLNFAFSLARLTAARERTFSFSSLRAWDIVSFPCLLFSKLFGILVNFWDLNFSSFSFWGLGKFVFSFWLLENFFKFFLSDWSSFSFCLSTFGFWVESFSKLLSFCLRSFLSSSFSLLPVFSNPSSSLKTSFVKSLFSFKLRRTLFFLTSTETDLVLPWEKLCLICPTLNVFFSWSFPELSVFLSLFSSILIFKPVFPWF